MNSVSITAMSNADWFEWAASAPQPEVNCEHLRNKPNATRKSPNTSTSLSSVVQIFGVSLGLSLLALKELV